MFSYSSFVLCIHGLPSSHCITTAEPTGRKEILIQVSVFSFDWGHLLVSTVWLLSLLSHIMGGLLNLSSRHDGLTNRSVTGLSSPRIIGVDLICNKDIYMSTVVS